MRDRGFKVGSYVIDFHIVRALPVSLTRWGFAAPRKLNESLVLLLQQLIHAFEMSKN